MGVVIMPKIRLVAPALILVAVVVLATAPAASARSDIALGISQFHGNSTTDAIRNSVQSFGTDPASWTLWSTWGNSSSREFPLAKAQALDEMGVTPMIWWEPMRVRESCDYARHTRIANGRYDRYIKRWARTAKQVHGTVLVRWAQEINGKFFPWGSRPGNRCGNTARSFKAAWRHIVRLFRNVGARNVRFVWSVSNAKNCRPAPCNQYKPYFPGNRFVHYVGFSTFNWGDPWTSMDAGVGKTYPKLRQFTRKPVIVIEVASNSEGGNKAEWIRQGYPAVYNRFAGVRGITYLNVDLRSIGHPDWSLNSDNALAAYNDVANDPPFNDGSY
jgi:beta-mannanase